MTLNRNTRFEDLPEFLTVEEFRVYLEIGRTTVYGLIRTDSIQYLRFGRRIWIPKSVLKSDQLDRDNVVKLSPKAGEQ